LTQVTMVSAHRPCVKRKCLTNPSGGARHVKTGAQARRRSSKSRFTCGTVALSQQALAASLYSRGEAVTSPAALGPRAIAVGAAVTGGAALGHLDGMNQVGLLQLARVDPERLGLRLDLSHRRALLCYAYRTHPCTPFSLVIAPGQLSGLPALQSLAHIQGDPARRRTRSRPLPPCQFNSSVRAGLKPALPAPNSAAHFCRAAYCARIVRPCKRFLRFFSEIFSAPPGTVRPPGQHRPAPSAMKAGFLFDGRQPIW
jgi:hypothetical protein